RRLGKNPVYYGLQGTTQQHLGEHLSDIVETVLGDLDESKMIELNEETGEFGGLNLGFIGSNYYLAYSTVELIASSVTAKTKTRGILEIVSAASEFAVLNMRQGEERTLKILSRGLPYIGKDVVWNDPNSKALVLLQAYFDRKPMNPDLKLDCDLVVSAAVKIIQACVDVIATNYHLKAAVAAMEVSQQVVQGRWKKDDVLLQIPHFTDELVKKAKARGVNSPFDVLEVEDEVREDLLSDFGEDSVEMSEIAAFCNSFPSVEVGYEVVEADDVTTGDPFRVSVKLQRDADDDEEEEEEEEDGDEEKGVVVSKRFPAKKIEGYWVCLGDPKTDKLYAVKRCELRDEKKLNLDAFAPEEAGEYELKLYVISDSYQGVDQEFDVKIKVEEGEEESEEEED
ncbi:hypothetical protein TrRE_jg10995, partial [Triparma retinervis]